jgi:hypothetical protein
MPGCPFIGLEGVVLYNGGGGGRFGRGSIRAVGSDEGGGGLLQPFREWKGEGHREAACACAREAAVAASVTRPREEDDRWGPCVDERGRGG